VVIEVNSNYFYAYEKFSNALRSLAVGPGDVRRRLHSAYLNFHLVRTKHLPEQLQDDFAWVMHQLTKFGPKIGRDGHLLRGSVDETLSRIRNSTGTKIAERIQHIYLELNRLYMERES
jgi:hypothetical protein